MRSFGIATKYKDHASGLDATTALENASKAGQTDWARITATFDATYDKVAPAAEDVSRKLGIVEKPGAAPR